MERFEIWRNCAPTGGSFSVKLRNYKCLVWMVGGGRIGVGRGLGWAVGGRLVVVSDMCC